MEQGANEQHPAMMKIALLSISTVLTSSIAIAASIPDWLKAFPQQSRANVELLGTLPSLTVIICMLLSSWVAKKIGTRRTILMGLLIAGIFGIIPVFFSNYYVLFFARLGLGAGFGLINSLAVSLIGTFFTGQEKANLMGYRGSCEMLGNALCTYVAGQLLVHVGWHSSFWVYALSFPLAILYFLYVPEPAPSQEADGTPHKESINSKVLFWTLILIICQMAYTGSTLRISELVTSYHIGSLNGIAIVLSFAPACGVISGIFFGRLLHGMGTFLLPVTIFCTGLSQLLIAFSNSFVLTSIGFLATSMISGLVISYILNLASDICETNSLNLTTSLMLVGCNIGPFLSPIVLGWLNSAFGANNLRLSYDVFGIILLGMGIVMVFLSKSMSASYAKNENENGGLTHVDE